MCCVMLYMLCYVALRCTVCVVLYIVTVMFNNVRYCAVLCRVVLYYVMLCYVVLYRYLQIIKQSVEF